MTILFREVSFSSSPPWSSSYYVSAGMDDPISPMSTRERTPSTGETCVPAHGAEVSMAELSNRFHQHTIQSRPSSYHFDAHQSCQNQYNVSKSQRFGNLPYNQQIVRRRRQSASRLQCSSACLEQIATLVEDIMKEREFHPPQPSPSPSFNSAKSCQDEETEHYPTLSRWPSLPTLSTPSTLTPSSPLSEDFEPNLHSSRKRHKAYRIFKEPTHRQISKRRVLVEKEVRIRRRRVAICCDQ